MFTAEDIAENGPQITMMDWSNCRHDTVYLDGFYKNRQRFMCAVCHRTWLQGAWEHRTHRILAPTATVCRTRAIAAPKRKYTQAWQERRRCYLRETGREAPLPVRAAGVIPGAGQGEGGSPAQTVSSMLSGPEK